MNLRSKMIRIFENINSDEYLDEEKIVAIGEILRMATHNSVTKDIILKAFKWLYEKTEKKQGNWIPVTDHMPDMGDLVFVTLKNGNIELDNVDLNGIWRTHTGSGLEKVVAWQPLPEPWKESRND